MKTFNRCAVLLLLAVSSARGESVTQTADDWYKNHYAPVWKKTPWDNAEEVSAFYDETLYLHPADGTINAVDSKVWIAESLAEWKSDGWLGSAIAKYRSDQINSSSVTFKVKWRDWYAGGEEDFSCGWYMADLNGARWVFTQYADIDCTEHDL